MHDLTYQTRQNKTKMNMNCTNVSFSFQEFTRLSKYVRLNWYNAQTLSESFQIKEIGAVVRVLRPIVIAFTLLMCSAGSLMFSMQYLHFFKGYPLATGVTQAIANVSFFGIFAFLGVCWVGTFWKIFEA
jgi:hypothetical protein